MKRLQTREIVAGVLLAALACRGDPTSSLRGGAKLIDLSTNVMFIDAGATKTLKVVVRDEQLNPLSADVTVASGNAAVVSVAVDTAVPVANGTTHSFLVTAVWPRPPPPPKPSGGPRAALARARPPRSLRV